MPMVICIPCIANFQSETGMNAERVLYSVSIAGALGIAYWATGLLISEPEYGEGIAFSEYSTISDPLFKSKDVVRIETLEADDELITGSVSRTDRSAWRAPRMASGYRIVAIYDRIAILEDKNSKIWAVSQDDQLPGAGRIREVTENDGRWIVITDRGLIVSSVTRHKGTLGSSRAPATRSR